jgi:hypothetical protein
MCIMTERKGFDARMLRVRARDVGEGSGFSVPQDCETAVVPPLTALENGGGEESELLWTITTAPREHPGTGIMVHF